MEFDVDVIRRNLPVLADGMVITLQLTGMAMVLGIAWGSVLAVARLSPSRLLSWLAASYVNTIRAVPLVMVIFWLYFLLPLVSGRQIGAFYSVLVAFVLFEGAYFSEIIRAGVKSVSQGQLRAALATGMSYLQAMRYVVLPQSFRRMQPVLLTQCIALFQDTSLAYVVGLTDFLTTSSIVANRDGRLTELYTFAAVTYMVISVAGAMLVHQLSRRNKLMEAR
jgi:glutamate/aspartate transport system permease protein